MVQSRLPFDANSGIISQTRLRLSEEETRESEMAARHAIPHRNPNSRKVLRRGKRYRNWLFCWAVFVCCVFVSVFVLVEDGRFRLGVIGLGLVFWALVASITKRKLTGDLVRYQQGPEEVNPSVGHSNRIFWKGFCGRVPNPRLEKLLPQMPYIAGLSGTCLAAFAILLLLWT